ncbi:hypothetical protein JRO89_XS01G0387500 [Xanthoceras sorbifolium]|uniref:Uncharacterized protein n=1 Tax=Xanthoceras sorbifolium TaxID=99658 RepID=A0ABQ8IQ04_9ROSI|nr:hypothetical protein JRO89_XS01G0387500 [Xanthoceras sorbifolium]
MVALCFVLDLRSLSSPLLAELKQLLLQLANFYAISPPLRQSNSNPLSDRIGLCYLFKNRISSSDELKTAYRPRGNLSLRDFHHAVNNLPTDAFLPEVKDSGAIYCCDVKLSSILSDRVLYSWGNKDIMRKVIVLSSCLPENMDSSTKKTLMDAADKCVSVEFVLFEQKSSHLCDMQEHINNFLRCISDLDNCSFQTYLPDVKVFQGLVKRWLQDLKDDMEEPLQARFVFKSNLVGSVNQITCNLCPSVNQIVDGFSPYRYFCLCHLCMFVSNKTNDRMLSCPVTGHGLETFGVIENSVKVGENTVLFMPSFQSSLKFQKISSPVDLNVIERTPLGSLNEGVMIGASFVVTPSTCQEMETASDETDQPELNAQLFRGLCSALHSLDQGLVCSSFCNVETMRKAAFHCYYILQPSDNGPMLLRRLAGSEEVLPVPDVDRFIDSSVAKEIEISIHTSLGKLLVTVKDYKYYWTRLSKFAVVAVIGLHETQAINVQIESREYNPLLHERGFHQKLNSLVKESLQFGSVPKLPKTTPELDSTQSNSVELTAKSDSAVDIVVLEEENQRIDLIAEENTTPVCIPEEWEQLVVSEIPKKYSPTCTSKFNPDQSVLSPPGTTRPLDEKTSKILERLEVPRQLKSKAVSPIITSNSISDACVPMKKPLIPFQPSQAAESTTSSQLMKPNFQRLKRKHK